MDIHTTATALHSLVIYSPQQWTTMFTKCRSLNIKFNLLQKTIKIQLDSEPRILYSVNISVGRRWNQNRHYVYVICSNKIEFGFWKRGYSILQTKFGLSQCHVFHGVSATYKKLYSQFQHVCKIMKRLPVPVGFRFFENTVHHSRPVPIFKKFGERFAPNINSW